MDDVIAFYNDVSISFISRSDAVEAKRSGSFIPLDCYQKYGVEPVKGEIGMLFGVRLFVKEDDKDA